MTVRNLDAFFSPRSIALIGASARPASVGNLLLRNLLSAGFAGPVMAVNPRGGEIEGQPVYESVAALPDSADLAVICTPAKTVPGLIEELGAKGTRAAVVITAGFAELGDDGRRLQQEMLEAARPHLMRIVGPNCLGLMAPLSGINASFSHIMAPKGDIAFVSQSGAVVTGVVDWAASRGIGFSHIVSVGGMADVDFGDLLDYFASDTKTRGVVLYVESVTDAAKFMSAGRAVSRLKPVVVVKAGRSAAGAKAAASHTGALAGSDAVYTTAFRRAGMLRASGLDELFDAIETLAARPGRRLEGPGRLGIVTNGGGIGVLASDFLQEEGGELAPLTEETIARLGETLPVTWSKGNPVDIIGDAPGARYEAAVRAVLADPTVDALLAINCPTAVADNVEAAHAVVTAASESSKPVLTCWLGDQTARPARAVLHDAGYPTYDTAAQAVHAYMYLVRHRRNQRLLSETPPLRDGPARAAETARPIIEKALEQGREWLSEPDAKAVLQAYGVPVAQTRQVVDADEAVCVASEIGFPVVLKIHSPDITHKTDVGGVALGLSDEEAVREAALKMQERVAEERPEAALDGFVVEPMVSQTNPVELILGLATDSVFGPVVLFGQGGTAVEVIDDKALALPPLNRALADDLVSRTRVSRLLAGYRDKAPADQDAIADAIMAIGDIAADFPQIVELDINPLLASPDGIIALDARVRVRPAPDARPGSNFAIRPYPRDLEGTIEDRDGRSYPVRPIRPNDAEELERFIDATNRDDLRFRFLSPLKKLPKQLVARLTQIDYDREMAFVVFAREGADEEKILGVGRLSTDPDRERAEYAVLVRSDAHGTGLGYALMRRLIEYARSQGVAELFGMVLRENTGMLDMCEELGFTRKIVPGEPGLVEVVLPLKTSG
ncbi:MAG: bifunctional acetate--CoA ligase family protein/GNAT family N-acetyltransferase [Parvibaculaceae bacterium]